MAKQLWIQLPNNSWCNAEYDVTVPNHGQHVTKDYNYELIDRKKLNPDLMPLSDIEKKFIGEMNTERSNRAISTRYQAEIETWRDTVNLSLQAHITEEIKGPGQADRMKVVRQAAVEL